MSQKELRRILGFEKNFSEFVLDPLYGPIGLTEEERDLINTRIFIRMKRIRQLGLVGEFYHGATHTRYEHSLGTLHVTWMMFKRFIENTQKYDSWISNDIINCFSDDTIKALRFAALLHDLGHGPFSHFLEDASQYFGTNIDHDKVTQFLVADRDGRMQISEAMSHAISKNKCLWRKFLNLRKTPLRILKYPPSMRFKILSIMNPEYRHLFKDSNFLVVKDFLHDLLYGDMGADRIDYLLRDTYYTGLGHRFNLSDLLDNIASVYDVVNGKLRFALDSNGKDVFDFFLTTRYYHYRLIAHNLKNIDMFARLRARMENWLNKSDEPLGMLVDVTLEDELYFEKNVPDLNEWSYERIGAWSLGQIRTDFYRYPVYRFLVDRQLRNIYLKAIVNRLRYGLRRFSSLDLNKRDIRIEFVLEKPHIPVVCAYRERYIEHKSSAVGRDEDEQMSALLHDYSDMIPGLARTYLSNVSVVVYVRKPYSERVKDYTSKTFDFFVNGDLFTSVLKHLNMRTMNRLDIMLASLFYVLKNYGEIDSLNRFCKILAVIQEELGTSYSSYRFGKQEAYEPQIRQPFDYPPDVINDLYVFDYSGIISISKINRNIIRIGPPKYMSCYKLEFPPNGTGAKLLRTVKSYYPRKYLNEINRLTRM